MIFGGLGLLLNKLLTLVAMFSLGSLIFFYQESWWQYILVGYEILIVLYTLFKTRYIEEAKNLDMKPLRKHIVKFGKKIIGRRFMFLHGIIYTIFIFYFVSIDPSFLKIQKAVVQNYIAPFGINFSWPNPSFFLYKSWTVRILQIVNISLLYLCMLQIDKIKEIFNISLKYIHSRDFIIPSDITKQIKDMPSADIVGKILGFFIYHKQYEILTFSNQQYCIKYGAINAIKIISDKYTKQWDKVIKKDLMNKLKKNFDIPFDVFEIILLQQDSVSKHFFDSDEYYIHNTHLDNFTFCSSCGNGTSLKEEHVGEWFCSETCRHTEEKCLQITNAIHHSRKIPTKNNENLTFISDSLSLIGGIATWIKNFQSINTGESYLSYAKQNAKSTGHGFAAEIMNHENDIFSGKQAQIVGGNNAKYGADRLVDGVKIQTKYYQQAKESVAAAFDKNGFKYLDENGNLMQIEVPKDQYELAVEIIGEKYKKGKLPQLKNIDEARNLVRKGSVTYDEAKNYTKFCSKESLYFDTRNGAIIALNAMGISFIINVGLCYYRSRNIKEAIRQSMLVGIKNGGRTFVTFLINAQIQRIPAINNFLQQTINFNLNKSVRKSLENIGKSTKDSVANTALRSTIVTTAATIVIASSFDIISMMCGKISGMQCIKNIAINTGSAIGGTGGALAGAAIGSMIAPGIGTIIGGLIGGFGGSLGGSFITNMLIDIEDDRQKKQRVFFSHLIHLSDLFKLSNQEADFLKSMVDSYISEKEDFFGSSFPVKNILAYSNSILKPMVVSIVSQRELIPSRVFQDSFINNALK